MSKSKNKKPKNTKPISERYTLKHIIANIYLTVMFTVFPLFVNLSFNTTFPFISFERGYVSIRHQKYFFFLIITAAAVIAEFLVLLTKSTTEQKEKNPDRKSEISKITFTDWAVIAFVVSCAISTVFSYYIELAFLGEISIDDYTHGRNNGLILMLFYAALYFFLTRCWKFKEYVFIALASVSGAISLLAVLNGFNIDPLGMFELFKNDENVFLNFMTTIGNKNMFASHLCVTLPVIIVMIVQTKKLWCRAVYLAAIVLGAMAIVVCDSDSVVLGLGVFAAVFTVVYCRHPKKIGMYFIVLAIMLLSIKLLGIFSALGGDNYKELGAIPFKLMKSNLTYAAAAILGVLGFAAFFLGQKRGDKPLPIGVPIAVGSLFGLAALAGLGTVVYFTAFDTETDLGELERTLRFSDAWGTHRGFMWNKSFEAFGKYNLFEKLFGKGPESFYYTFSPYFAELYDRFGDSSTDAAHNEYINYLMNIGIVGLCSYLAFTGSALVRAFKAARRNPLSLVFASAVVAYMAQATVNISLPIATPLFMIFVSLCEASARQSAEPTGSPRF